MKSTLHYRRTNTDSTIMIILICTMLMLCVLIFYRKVLRATIRSLFFRRTGLHSSSSSSNFNQRYQLLTAIVIEDSSSLSNTYSSGKASKSSLASYNGRLRNVWKIYLSVCFFLYWFSLIFSFSYSAGSSCKIFFYDTMRNKIYFSYQLIKIDWSV